jgi:CubicO group peptidase (beta-lactamase class C family)
MNRKAAIVPALIAALCVGCVNSGSNANRGTSGVVSTVRGPFEAASTVDETFRWHRALPTATTAWWDVVGEQQAWYFKNLHQLYPSVNVYRDGPVSELRYRLVDEIASYPVETPAGEMRYVDFLHSDHSTTMGMVIVHRGEIVFETYPRMKEYEKPLYWSVTKAFVSTVLAILEDEGLVDVSKPIEFYIPELKDSQLAGITVRNALDMASGIDCSDNYEDIESCYYRFETSLGDGFFTEDSPDNPYDMLINFDYGYWGEQGTGFDYSGVNTFLVGWIVEKVTRMPFQDALTSEVWRHIGAEADASIFAGRYGVPLTSGGLMARIRDVARFGLLFTPSYRVVTDKKIISDRYLDIILNGGRPELLANARFGAPPLEGIKHNVYQWDLVFDNNNIYKGGWAGQGLLINPDRDYVAVYTGYFKDRENSEVSPLPVLLKVLEGVFGNPPKTS